MTEIDSLYYDLGKDLLGDSRSAFKKDSGFYIQAGKKWFEANIDGLKKILCTSDVINTKETDVVAAIADLVSSISIGVAPVNVAKLVLRMGVEKMCENFNG